MSIKKGIKTVYKTLVPLKPRVYIRARFDFYKYKLYHFTRKFIRYKFIENYHAPSILNHVAQFTKKPSFSFIILDLSGAADHTPLLNSLKRQLYNYFELIVPVTAANKERLADLFAKAGLKATFVEQDSTDLSALLKQAKGTYTGILYAQDELTRGSIYELANSIVHNKVADFIYTDDDKFIKPKKYILPNYKPDYSPVNLLSQNYIGNLSVFNTNLVQSLLAEEPLQDAEHYDLILKIVERTDQITHIPKVLYHQRISQLEEAPTANESTKKTVERALRRRGIEAEVLETSHAGIFRIKRKINGNPLISIITPFKDKPELLKMCLDSILSLSTYQNFEFIGISNNSTQPETFALMKEYSEKDSRIKFYEKNIPFNFSTLNNYAAEEIAKGEHLLLLNNDIEIITPGWMEALLEYSQLSEVGAVGAKLYYPNDEIQHAGVIVGLGGAAGHSHKMHHRRDYGFNGRLHIAQNLSAVTAACLMIKKKAYFEVEGLEEENLKVAFNDVDFCLKLREKGFQNIFTPYCEAYHHESISRGVEDTKEKLARFNHEMDYLKKRHRLILSSGDPYYNPNLTHFYEDFSIGFSKVL